MNACRRDELGGQPGEHALAVDVVERTEQLGGARQVGEQARASVRRQHVGELGVPGGGRRRSHAP